MSALLRMKAKAAIAVVGLAAAALCAPLTSTAQT
jgi:hypothetical protein